MLKQHGGSSAAMCVPDDRPRKKLSFRDPEVVVTPARNGTQVEPSRAHYTAALPTHSALHHSTHHHHHHAHHTHSLPHPNPHSQSHPDAHQQQQQGGRAAAAMGRPHSIAGIVGLGGLSSVGGVASVTSQTSVPAPVTSTEPLTGLPSVLGNPGLLGPLATPGVLAGAATPILTPPTSPTHTAASQLATPPVRPGPARQSSPPSSKVAPTQPSTPAERPTSATQPTKMSTSHQHHPSKQAKSASQLGKALPPTGSKGTSHLKQTKPASRSSSLKKQRSSPVHQAVTFLTDEGIVNGRSRPPQPDPSSALSLEDIDLESQAMRVVRTVGQAFEVCHKISVKDTPPSPEPQDDQGSDHGSDASTEKLRKDLLDTESTQEDLVTLTPSDSVNEDSLEQVAQRPNKLEPLAPPAGSDILTKVCTGVGETYTSPLSEPLPSGDSLPMAGTPLSVHHELQLMREQLEQQQQQTQAAVSQVHLLRDQLAAETAARLEAQARTHQLLVHNKELLEHIQALVLQVRDLELKLAGGSAVTHLLPSPPELKSQLLVTEASPGHSSQLAAALDLGGAAPHFNHPLDFPLTPSPTLPQNPFSYPSPSSPASPAASLPGGLHLRGGPGPLKESSPASHSRNHSPRAASMGPLIHPLPVWGSEGSGAGEVTLAVPRQEPHLSTRQQAVPRPKPGQRLDECSSTPSLSSESDPKRDSSGQSSGESVTQAVAQLYSLDSQRLAQVPEDAITMGPYGLNPLGNPRNLNGPITRTASERVSRQETLAQLQRMAWARHTTK